VQDALGDLHDADVRVRRLLQAPGEADAGLESYQIAAQAEPAACRRAFEVLWPSITRRRFRRRLARCLAEL
jgi:CHAD domain-containing protein